MKKIFILFVVTICIQLTCFSEADFNQLLNSAQQGDAQAQHVVGLCYANGTGVEKNIKETYKWWHMAAAQGYPAAQYNLGLLYANGEGAQKDYNETVKWWVKAAEQGLVVAQFNLGVCFENGSGVETNIEEAVRWYHLAAKQGDLGSQRRLANYYVDKAVELHGAETKRFFLSRDDEPDEEHQKNMKKADADFEEAFKWFEMAALQGGASDQYTFGNNYYYGVGTVEDVKTAVMWFRRAAEQGYAAAQYSLGLSLSKGEGQDQNLEEAVIWYRRAAEQGVPDAQYKLGLCYDFGAGVNRDVEDAVKWHLLATQAGNKHAKAHLQVLHDYGPDLSPPTNVTTNEHIATPPEINRLTLRAHNERDLDAQWQLAQRYLMGLGVEKNLEQARKWCLIAAAQEKNGQDETLSSDIIELITKDNIWGNNKDTFKFYYEVLDYNEVEDIFNLGLCYMGVQGVPEDSEEAVKWLRLAAENGHARAQYNLAYYCYGLGSGVRSDSDELVKWMRRAAEQGLAKAQSYLGAIYADGDDLPRDYGESVRWYQLAAEQEFAEAQYELGNCYANGLGVSQDEEEAVRWYLKASKQEYAHAEYELAQRHEKGNGVRQSLKDAIRYYYLAIKHGLGMAKDDLRRHYVCIHGSSEFSEDSRVAYRIMAAELGCAEAQYDMAFPEGEDLSKSILWLRLAAEQGHGPAQQGLAVHYSLGWGVLEDGVEAYAWAALAALSGKVEAIQIRDEYKRNLTQGQVVRGQQRARELQAMIERKKEVSALGSDEMPSADISPSGFGSGLLIDGGYVLTCWHVVEGGGKVSVSCNGKDYAASVVQKDPANDIAVLRVVDAPAGVSLSLADSKLGANVFTMGFPHPDLQGSNVKFTTGSISGLTGPGNAPLYYQISAPIQSGNSGGPLFDEQGNLVGMVAAKLDSLVTLAATGDLTQNVNYAIKADYLKPLLKTVDGISIQPTQTQPVNLLSLVEELKKSVVMIKVY